MLTPRRSHIRRLGRVVMTPGAQAAVPDHDLADALQHHANQAERGTGDAVAPLTQCAGLADCRLLSACRTRQGTRFWILSEAGQHRTTVLLPEEFTGNSAARRIG